MLTSLLYSGFLSHSQAQRATPVKVFEYASFGAIGTWFWGLALPLLGCTDGVVGKATIEVGKLGYNGYMNVQQQVVQQGIAKDADFVGRFAKDIGSSTTASYAAVVSLCMAPYFSLFVHESYRKLKEANPGLSSLLSSDVEAIVARSRHSLKLFEDTHRGVTGQLEYFRDELLPAHHSRFFGTRRFDPVRFLRTDLGRYSYDERLVAMTHGANFHLGIEPDRLLKEGFGPELATIYEEYGSYFARLGARMDVAGSTFVGHLDPKLFNQREDDVQSKRYYAKIFNGATTPELNALLTVFQSMMNFVDTVITVCHTMPVTEYTVWKIRFLTLYQILGSLQALRSERMSELTATSIHYIDCILGTPEVQLIMQPAAKSFRNTLMHYNVNHRLDPAQIDLSEPLFGLVPVYYPGHSTTTLESLVDASIAASAAALNEWASHI